MYLEGHYIMFGRCQCGSTPLKTAATSGFLPIMCLATLLLLVLGCKGRTSSAPKKVSNGPTPAQPVSGTAIEKSAPVSWEAIEKSALEAILADFFGSHIESNNTLGMGARILPGVIYVSGTMLKKKTELPPVNAYSFLVCEGMCPGHAAGSCFEFTKATLEAESTWLVHAGISTIAGHHRSYLSFAYNVRFRDGRVTVKAKGFFRYESSPAMRGAPNGSW